MRAAPLGRPVAFDVRLGNGVEVRDGDRVLSLDPDTSAPHAVLSHAHLDHVKGSKGGEPAWMTAATLDLMRSRKAGAPGRTVAYGEAFEAGGFPVRLHDAGHVLGSAMAEVGDVLYTGDFNPTAGLLHRGARPVRCDTLVIESTYGDPRMDLPPKALVLDTLETWTLRRLVQGSVALGSHPLGRAQELIAMFNRSGVIPVVSADIAQMTAVYNAHGADLDCIPLGSPKAQELAGRACYVVPRQYLKKGADFAKRLRAEGGSAAYLSGWCHRYSYFRTYDIDAQFVLSDHAGFKELLSFAEACAPRRVFTFHGDAEPLAAAMAERLGVPSQALARPVEVKPARGKRAPRATDPPPQ